MPARAAPTAFVFSSRHRVAARSRLSPNRAGSSKAFVKASFGAKISLIVLRALRVIGKRDDDADQPPVLVVEEG
jgi:hypothetical protein